MSVNIFRGAVWTEANDIEARADGWCLTRDPTTGMMVVDASPSSALTQQQARAHVAGLVEKFDSLGVKAALVVGKSHSKILPDLEELTEAFWSVAAHLEHPNQTAYLVWFYLTKGLYGQALDVYVRDADKVHSAHLGLPKAEVLAALEELTKG